MSGIKKGIRIGILGAVLVGCGIQEKWDSDWTKSEKKERKATWEILNQYYGSGGSFHGTDNLFELHQQAIESHKVKKSQESHKKNVIANKIQDLLPKLQNDERDIVGKINQRKKELKTSNFQKPNKNSAPLSKRETELRLEVGETLEDDWPEVINRYLQEINENLETNFHYQK